VDHVGKVLPQELPRDLEDLRKSLNDYVHPNYGSHTATIRPEVSSAGDVLLFAFVRVYEEFFRLDALRRFEAMKTGQTGPKTSTASEEWQTYIEETISRIDTRMRARGYPHDWIPNSLASLQERVQRDEREWASLLVDSEENLSSVLGENIESLREFCEGIYPVVGKMSARDILGFPFNHPEFGLPSGFKSWLSLCGIRGLAARLESLVHEVEPSSLLPQKPPYAPWPTSLDSGQKPRTSR
jgi:hypothetical protein